MKDFGSIQSCPMCGSTNLHRKYMQKQGPDDRGGLDEDCLWVKCVCDWVELERTKEDQDKQDEEAEGKIGFCAGCESTQLLYLQPTDKDNSIPHYCKKCIEAPVYRQGENREAWEKFRKAFEEDIKENKEGPYAEALGWCKVCKAHGLLYQHNTGTGKIIYCKECREGNVFENNKTELKFVEEPCIGVSAPERDVIKADKDLSGPGIVAKVEKGEHPLFGPVGMEKDKTYTLDIQISGVSMRCKVCGSAECSHIRLTQEPMEGFCQDCFNGGNPVLGKTWETKALERGGYAFRSPTYLSKWCSQ